MNTPLTENYLSSLDAVAEAFGGYRVASDIRRLVAEVRRLKRGDFTPKEFQDLCHHRDERPGCTRESFEAGCREYQRKLFGSGGND